MNKIRTEYIRNGSVGTKSSVNGKLIHYISSPFEIVRPNLFAIARAPFGVDVTAPARSRTIASAPLGGDIKRAVDIAIASLVLLLLSPLVLIIIVSLYLTSGRPIFFSHERIGFDGMKFRCHKFRTMVTNSQEVLAKHLARNSQAAAEWASNQKLKIDPRVTYIGRLLRKSSLDELPQLVNILRGEMTCVGPRPVVEAELRRYGKSARYYLKTRPGLTGLWQVSGRNSTGYKMRIALDRAYVTEWSVQLDVAILVKTIPAILRHRESS